MINREAEAEREEALRSRIAALPRDKREAYYHNFRRRVKDPDTYAVLNYLFVAGLHHFYLGRWLRGAVNLIVFCTGIAALVRGEFGIGLALLVLITAAELPALFFAQAIVARENNDRSEKLLKELGG